MSHGDDLQHSRVDDSDNMSRKGRGRQTSPPTQLHGVSIDAEADTNMIYTLNSLPEMLIKALPEPPRIPTHEIMLDKSNSTKKHVPLCLGPKGLTRFETTFN